MTTRPSRMRRAREWVWRGGVLAELEARAWTGAQRERLREAQACQLLAWRTLAGLEPVPAATRQAVAKPLLRAGLEKCLPLLDPPSSALDELFGSSAWQERFADAGVGRERQAAAHDWLLDGEGANGAAAPAAALIALRAVLESLDLAQHAIRRLLWRRVRVLGVVALVLVGLVSGVVLLLAPPEGADLGAGKPWHASSAYPGFVGAGNKPVKPKEGAFFATNDELNPWWVVDLQALKQLASVTIVNRSDCCPDRAVPLALELSTDGQNWREVARTADTFRTWKPSFPPRGARFVRLRALRRTILHFKDVRIHAAPG